MIKKTKKRRTKLRMTNKRGTKKRRTKKRYSWIKQRRRIDEEEDK